MKASVATGQQTFSSHIIPARSSPLDRWAVRRIQHSVAGAPLRFKLWDGFELASVTASPAATVVFKNRRALFSWIWDPDLNFGEAYMSGAVEIEGDLRRMLEVTYQSLGTKPRPWWLWQSSNDVSAARDNVHRHYDLGNDFYRLWLDRAMVYTCAYFRERGRVAGGGAGGKNGSCLPQAAPAAGRACARSRLRLGRAGPAHGAALWRRA